MFKIEMIGHLGADARLVEYEGQRFVTFPLYWSEEFTDKATGEIVSRQVKAGVNINFDVKNLMPYLKVGEQCFVRGDGRVRTYRGNDGVVRAGVDIRCTELRFIWPRKTQQGAEQVPVAEATPMAK